MIRALNVHRNTHGRSVSNKRMQRVIGWHNQAGSNGLLPEIIVKNLLLDTIHDLPSEETNNGQIHACIH